MHAVIAFSALPLFLGALLSDWAYARSFQVQWTNFAEWLIAGGLVFTGVALLWAVVDVLRPRERGRHEEVVPGERRGRGVWYVLLLLATVALGIANALVHAKDGWAAMPAGPVLSVVVLLVGAAAAAVGLARMRHMHRIDGMHRLHRMHEGAA